jgi:cobalt-zinc-cadmium efflux system protein
MSHAHGESCHHGHELGHSHAPKSFGFAFAIGVCLNGGFVIGEIVFGLRSGSLALLADAGHNAGDVLGLLAAWTAALLVTRAPTERHTYGFRRSPILAALLNASLLLVTTGGIVWEALRRMAHPPHVQSGIVIDVAAVGIVVNLATALMFASGRKGEINVRGAYLHMMGDAAVAAGVVVAGLLLARTGKTWIDPAVSLAVALIVLWASWKLLTEALHMAMDAVPRSVDPDAVREYLLSLPGVTDMHDLHIWSMSTSEVALTVHLLCPEGVNDDFLVCAASDLRLRYGIVHPTVQIERGDGAECPLASEHVV